MGISEPHFNIYAEDVKRTDVHEPQYGTVPVWQCKALCRRYIYSQPGATLDTVLHFPITPLAET